MALNPNTLRGMTINDDESVDFTQNVTSAEKIIANKGLQAGESGTAGVCDLRGGGSSAPSYVILESADGTPRYIFVENDGTLKAHTAVPTQDSDGAVVGAQT